MDSIISVESTVQSMVEALRQKFQQDGIESPAFIGIRTGGVWVAKKLHKALECKTPLGELDISFYRDDFTQNGLNPMVKPSSLPFETEDRVVVLVDDVVMSGRTIRAAMNEIFDYGRPARVILVSLVDVGHRELPIQPDVVGHIMNIMPNEQVKLRKDDEGNLILKKQLLASG